MEDIARECGVTKMTVSRVLAGGNNVKPATREKVLKAAKHLRYEINVLAQNLNSNRSGYIGVATPFEGLLGSPYFAAAFKGFRIALNGSGLDFALFDTDSEEFNSGAKLAKLYRQRKVDGLLVVALHTYDRFLDTSEHTHIPMVVVGEQPATETVCSVSCDDRRGIQLVCEHLYGLGHRRIAFVEGPAYVTTAEHRKAAYTAFCEARGLRLPPWYVQPANYSMHSGREAGRALLQGNPRPTAIIAANDPMALGVMESARELKIRVPQDLSLAGFDDLPATQEHFPPLTTVHQPVSEMGERGARILLEAMEEGTMPTGRIVMDVSLVVRESTAAC